MSAGNMAGMLPEGDANGLAPIALELVEHPRRRHVVVAIVDTKSIKTNVDDGSRTATVRIRRIEAITDPGDRAHMQRLLMREFERRTGETVLPFDLENDVRAAFEDDQTGDMP